MTAYGDRLDLSTPETWWSASTHHTEAHIAEVAEVYHAWRADETTRNDYNPSPSRYMSLNGRMKPSPWRRLWCACWRPRRSGPRPTEPL